MFITPRASTTWSRFCASWSASFPRWYAREWRETSTLGPTLNVGGAGAEAKGFRETVVDYLAQELVQHADAERRAVLSIAEELLADGG